MKELHICHVTTVHQRSDTRVFVKQCRYLAKAGHKVTLLVADGKGNECVDGVNIVDVGKHGSRVSRLLVFGPKICRAAWNVDADVYHIHDPELVLYFSLYKLFGRKVVYDVHEDLQRQVLRKYWITPALSKFMVPAVGLLERLAANTMSGIVTVTPVIQNKFSRANAPVVEVRNYPVLDEFGVIDTSGYSERPKEILYVGGISLDRGIDIMLDCLQELPDVRLNLAGKFSNGELESFCKAHPAWERVNYLGWCDRQQIEEQMKKNRIGMVVLKPTGDYEDALPVKLFEYMAAGLPAIYSRFPFWCSTVQEHDVGIDVDPSEPGEVKAAIVQLLQDETTAYQQGTSGRKAVFDHFSWDAESKKLEPFYRAVIAGQI